MDLRQYIANLNAVGINVPVEVQEAAESVHRLHDEIANLRKRVEGFRRAEFEQGETIKALRSIVESRTITLSKLAKAVGVRKRDLNATLGETGFGISEYNDLPMNVEKLACLILKFKK